MVVSSEPPAGGFGNAKAAHLGGIEGPERPSSGPMLAIGVVGAILVLLGGGAVYELRKVSRFYRVAGLHGAVRSIAEASQRHYAMTHELCPTARPVPPDFALVKGRTFRADSVAFDGDPGWDCLDGGQIHGDLPFQLRYERTAPDAFIAVVEGDRDGDGVRSHFQVRGKVVGSEVVLDPMEETNPDE